MVSYGIIAYNMLFHDSFDNVLTCNVVHVLRSPIY